MTDRELLDLAARATKYGDIKTWEEKIGKDVDTLEKDGGAFRLMVALGISPEVYRELSVVEACTEVECFYEKIGEGVSTDAAIRRAIVRAAAAMGEKS